MFLNPDHLTAEQMRLVDAWLVANGCRHHVAREPIRILGDRVYYTALSLRNDASLAARPVRDGQVVPLGRRVVTINVPLSDYLPE